MLELINIDCCRDKTLEPFRIYVACEINTGAIRASSIAYVSVCDAFGFTNRLSLRASPRAEVEWREREREREIGTREMERMEEAKREWQGQR